jgi:hypothetical protein
MDSRIGYHTIAFCQVDGFRGLFQVRARDDQLLTAGFSCPGKHAVKIVGMSLGAMVDTAVDGVREVDANLLWRKVWLAITIGMKNGRCTYIYISRVGCILRRRC